MKARLALVSLLVLLATSIGSTGVEAIPGSPPIKVVSHLSLDVDHPVSIEYGDSLTDNVQVSGTLQLTAILTINEGVVTGATFHTNVRLAGAGTYYEAYSGFGAYNWKFAPSGPPITPAGLGDALSLAGLESVATKLGPSPPPISPTFIPGDPPISPVFQPGRTPIMPLFISLSLVFDEHGSLTDLSAVEGLSTGIGLGD